MGFTFNNEKEQMLIKQGFRSTVFFHNKENDPSLMKSATAKDSLRVVIESNAEEIQRYEESKKGHPTGDMILEPTEVTVAIHSPKEPANIRARGFKIPLGQKTIVYMTPKATRIDESGKKLAEIQRGCRLEEDTKTMDVFNMYTRTGCLFECQMKYSKAACGCIPWNYPISVQHHVNIICLIFHHLL